MDSIRPYPRLYIKSAQWIHKYFLGIYYALGTVLGHSDGLETGSLSPWACAVTGKTSHKHVRSARRGGWVGGALGARAGVI